ncbi:MAG: CRISPR system precrRNA processing endoribonuclease RAMP protein Cas6 [Rhodobacteraceae bacterium]|nr:CRISPR system precrRNA processing endoribonuclease RAMP protein Cas6 [Paracoccaceae bacterium]
MSLDSLIEEELFALTRGIDIIAIRMLLDTGSLRATVPMLRGVWGRALRDIDPLVYRAVFEGNRSQITSEGERTNMPPMPLYVMRPAPPDPAFAPAVELLLLGYASRQAPVALRAFKQAAQTGLGPRRVPFRIRRVCGIQPDRTLICEPQMWNLHAAAYCMSQTLHKSESLRVEFEGPLRLLRRGSLIDSPSFIDLAIVGLRRLCALSSAAPSRDLQAMVLEAARSLPASIWCGQRHDLVRWSGRQKRRIEMRGVTGWLDLPDGAGPFRPLLAACEWAHLGKGTVFGLGRYSLRSLQR